MKEPKRIIMDVDGVLLAYEATFSAWMGWDFDESGKYGSFEALNPDKSICIPTAIETFNASPNFARIPPLEGAVEFVREVRDRGYAIDIITSCGESEEIHQMRRENLATVFGKDAFDSIVCLPLGTCKRESLSKYAGSGAIWLDDSMSHYRAGEAEGLFSILVNTPFNMDAPFHEYRQIDNLMDLIDAMALFDGKPL